MARVMIADDSKFMRTIVKDTFLEAGTEIIGEVDNGSDAVTEYKRLNPDIITMDITMHGKDGLAAIDEIYEYNPNAIVFIISALSKQTILNSKSDIEMKVKEYITKPFDKHSLIEIINKYK